jgi:hypothetical protein
MRLGIIKKKILTLVFTFIILIGLNIITPANAASYSLTLRYEVNLYLAFAETTAGKFVKDLDAGEKNCKSLVIAATAMGYDPEYLDPLAYGRSYIVKNESGKTIASGKFRPKFSRPGEEGDAICRVDAKISLPKAKFYDIVDRDGNNLISGFPFSKFKKNKVTVEVLDWN